MAIDPMIKLLFLVAQNILVSAQFFSHNASKIVAD